MKAACVFLLAGSTLALVAPAFASQALPGGPNADIIVTAQRRAESINDVGMAIQAVDSSTLQNLRVTDVRDLTAVAPSFTVSRSSQGVPTYTLRGIGFNTVNLSATSTVGTYVDDVAYAYPIMNTGPMMDLQRVEVLKGPQGTLYGRNTTAGLINFITNKPTDTFEGGVRAELGNYQTYNLEGHVSGPLAQGVAARLAVRWENSDKGWQISNSRPNERLGKVDKLGLRGALALDPTPTTHIDASVTWWQNKSDTVAGQPVGFTPATDPLTGTSQSHLLNVPGLGDYVYSHFPTNAKQADWVPEAERSQNLGTGLGLPGPLAENNHFWGLKLRIDQELGDNISLTSLTSYNYFHRDALADWGGAPFEVMVDNMIGTIKSFAQELHLEGENGPFTWLVGGYYGNDRIYDSDRIMFNDNVNARTIRFAGLGLLDTPFNQGGYTALEMSQSFRTFLDYGRLHNKTWSIFANADARLNDQLKLTLGVRYTQDKEGYAGCSADVNGNMLPNVNVVNAALYFQTYGAITPQISEGDCVTYNPDTNTYGEVVSQLNENNVAWRVALNWQPNQDTLVYASVSRGFKNGSTPINAANIARQNAPVHQERLTAYEVGVKASLADRAIQASGAVFYYDYKNKQISTLFADPIYTALSRLDNVPKSKAYGIEGELTLRPVQQFSLTANALWLKTRVDGYVGINTAGQVEDYDGAEFINSPRFQASAIAAFNTPVTDTLDFNANASLRYQTKSHGVFENTPLYDINSFAVVNGSLGVRSHAGWSASLWAKNLFDKYYWAAVNSSANTVVRFPNQPRTFGITLGFDF